MTFSQESNKIILCGNNENVETSYPCAFCVSTLKESKKNGQTKNKRHNNRDLNRLHTWKLLNDNRN